MPRRLVALCCLVAALPAQFERYRGPGDVRAQPPQPRAATPGVPRSGVTGWDEPNRWSFWWMFHRDRFVPPAMPLLPSERGGLAAAAAALHATLAETDDAWLAATCLFALAKLDAQSPATERAQLARLAAPEPRVREAATLGLGLVATPAAAQRLAERLADVTASERDRAFAAWALGLASSRAGAAIRPGITASLLLAAQEDPSVEVGVAALHALAGTGRDDPTASAVDAELREALHGSSPLRVAHAATALARWLGRGGDRGATATLLVLLGHGEVDVRRAAVVALGRLAIPEDAEVVAALVRATADRDSQTGCFAIMALGELGSPAARGALLERFATEWSFTQGWCALGLGLIARAAEARGVRDSEIGPLLLATLGKTKNPELQCALAIALGLARYTFAATDLRALLAKYRKDDERAGSFAQALALLCDTSAEPLIREVLAVSPRRPELLKQLAPCLGWLSSRDAAPQVAQLLLFPSRNNALITGSAVADAVALCRDESTFTNLVQLLRDPTCSVWSRAGAAAALGSIGHAGARTWSADYAEHINYRAATATMTEAGGLLVLH